MNQSLELIIAYKNQRKLIVFERDTSFSAFKIMLKTFFSISNQEIMLIDINRNAEITSVYSFREGKEIEIQGLEDNPINERMPDENFLLQQNNAESIEIRYADLIEKTFTHDELLEKVNEWAIPKKFKLYYSEGAKETKKGVKRTLACQITTCKYRIVFKSNNNDDNFKIYEKLSQKYMTHSNFLYSSHS